MEYPTRAIVSIKTAVNIEVDDSDKERFEQEGFSEDDIRDCIEQTVKKFVLENIEENNSDIVVTFQ